MPTWKLTLEYDGSRFRGWQSQDNARTVQGVLQEACSEVLKGPVQLGGAGRTDAGVHALRQVAHLRCRHHLPCVAIESRLNQRLPASIHVLSVQEAPDRFHARHDAESRYYLYQIALRRTAFGKDLVWWVREPMDLARMATAAQLVVGRHDFRLYQDRRAEPGQSSQVQVLAAQLRREGNLALVRIGASHFLWRMVRRLVGALVRVGTGEFAVEEFRESLQGKGREVGEWTAPASGLFLERVVYPGEAPPGDLLPVLHM